MGLAAPVALLGLLAVPLIVAFYMLRLRRNQQRVSSTYLWQHLVRDLEANAPWQRLRRSLLLILQLLLAVLLAVMVAQPFLERPAGLARDLVLVVDSSASMASTDVFPDRLGAAKRAAIEALSQVPADGRVSVIAAGETARVMANEATDRGRIARAIEQIEQSTTEGNMTEALRLAGKLAERARGAEVLVISDDAGSQPPNVRLDVPVRAIAVGRERDNQAIAALAVQADPSGLRQTVFVSVANYSAGEVVRRLQILTDGELFDSRDLVLRPLSRNEVVIEQQLPSGTSVIEARVVPPDESGGELTGPPDHLALDDAAWAIVPSTETRYILLVGPGNVYLQNALALLPNVELYGTTAEQYANTAASPEFAEYDLVVFDGFLPPALPNKAILGFAPPRTSDLGVVTGTLDFDEFGLGQLPLSEPLLRGVDLSTVHIAETQRLELPEWARPVIPGTNGPLLYSGLRQGLPTAVFAFDPRNSDLPLQVAWPVLISNLASELLGIGPAAPDPLQPAQPIDLPLTADAIGVRVTLPDGSVQELAPGATGASTVTFVSTQQLGVYRVEPMPDPAASPAPTGQPSPSPGSVAAASTEPTLFAVNLFSHEESNIQPGDGARLAALGNDEGGEQVAAGLARDEFWPLLVLLVLVFLLVEWLVYERDGARRIAGWLRRTARLGRGGAG